MTFIYIYLTIGFLTSIYQLGRCVEAYYNKNESNKKDIWLIPLANLPLWPINLII